MTNERGITLVEVLVALAITAIIGIVSMQLIGFQIDYMQSSFRTRFYDELLSIEKSFSRYGEDATYSVTENAIEIKDEIRTTRVEVIRDRVTVTEILHETDSRVTRRLNTVVDMKVYKVDTVTFVGETAGTNLIYNVGVNNFIQVLYTMVGKSGEVTEVLTYVFE